jgi:hypothetical protein
VFARQAVIETTDQLIERLTKDTAHQSALVAHVNLQVTGFPLLRANLKKLSKHRLASLARRVGVDVPYGQPMRVWISHLFVLLKAMGAPDADIADIAFRVGAPDVQPVVLLVKYSNRDAAASHVFCTQDLTRFEYYTKFSPGVMMSLQVEEATFCGLTCPCGKCGT